MRQEVIMKILTVISGLILTTVLLVGCSSQAPPGTELAPDFQLPNLEGQSISLSDFRGEPVLVNFWASWCSPCIYEMPFIQEVFEEWSGQGLVVLAVNKGESLSAVNDFMQSGNFSFPVLLDINQYVALEYNAWRIPTTFFIDKDGMIQAIKVGPFLSKAEIEMMLSEIIP
jgi:cytochrome c biogenesis protein CcmG/thiol:disulfide interchange protein DsbE